MRKFILALLATVLLAPLHPTRAAAEAEGDARIAQLHQEHPELGFLLFDVTVLNDGKRVCSANTVSLTSNTRKQAQVDVNPGSFIPSRRTRGALASLEPAVWTIGFVECSYGKYAGPFAKIRIEAGDIVNAGNLIVDVYTIRPRGLFQGAIRGAHATVEDLPAEAVESLQQRAPATLAKAKRRYFEANADLSQVRRGEAPAKH